MAQQSIATKIANRLLSTATSKLTNKVVNSAFAAVGLGNRTPKRLMPHELQHLINQYPDFGLDVFSGRQFWKNKMVNEITLTELKNDLSAEHNVKIGKGDLKEAVHVACFNNPFSPVQRYLSNLKWDRTDRIEQLVRILDPIYQDAEHEALVKRIIECFLVASVARVFEPGCKVDNILVLVGKTGAGKSTFFRALASPAWFRDSNFDISSREGMQSLQGVWLYELAELRQLLGKDDNLVKGFISSQEDTYRAPWGRFVEGHPRTAVFCGTTNEDRFLTDKTGTRRYLVVEVGKINLHELGGIRNSIWAQAVSLFNAGTQHWLNDGDMIASEKYNDKYKVIDA
jgi:putative DNA primase/helicase